MTDVTLTFPDGAERKVKSGTTGLEVAKSISPSLAKRTVAMQLDGALADLSDPINKDASINFVARTDPAALELIRHDAAHVMAEAVQSLWPGTQVTIGPVIDNGFFYDFAKQQPFEPEDIAKIEKKMDEIIARNAPFTKEVWIARQGQEVLQRQGRVLQDRAGRRDSRRPGSEDLQAGRVARSLPRPAHDLDRPDRQGVQADEVRRRLLARRLQQSAAAAHLRHRLGDRGRARSLPASRSRRRRSAITASSAARWTCSISRKRRRAPCSGIRRAGRCSRR